MVVVMTERDRLFSFINENYETDEPVFLSDLKVQNMKAGTIRQEIRNLIGEGRLKKFDTGIYYLPSSSSIFGTSVLSIDEVIRKKYLLDEAGCCGYIAGILLANELRLTTQVPSVYEIYTNRATSLYRETELASRRIIIRKPCCKVTQDNVYALQLLDLVKEITDVAEVETDLIRKRISHYMDKFGLTFNSIEPFISFYPDKIYRNLYEVGLLNGKTA